MSQAVSSAVVLEKLIDTLMRSAIAQAGAERGLLVVLGETEPRIEAQATTCRDTVLVELCDASVSSSALPETVLHYVLRTGEIVALDDATAELPFARDPYILEHGTRSILCLPLMNQSRLTGALYLENNLAPRVFVPARLAVLTLLASQAAIALENARLYRDLAGREARFRRLVDANIIGIIVWNFDGDILEANDAFLRMVGYERADLISGRVRWADLTPPEWRETSERAIAETRRMQNVQPYEKEYIRKDGSRVPVILGMAAFEAGGEEGAAFALDLTERKRAEEEARESERRNREVQTELAHANRVDTIGQLAASIAHEVNQPIGAIVTNAEAALRWLGAKPPNDEEVRLALSRIVSEGRRAANVIGRIRELIKKAPPRKEPVDINGAIREVVELTRGEAARHSAFVQMQLADDIPFVEGDRVELQQVLLNLIVNAIEAMGSITDGKRELLITTGTAAAGYVFVAVRDSGPGLATESTERVFTPFYTTKSTGLGIGLSICRSIIDAHGGRLWASAHKSRGAVFQFTIPVHQAPLS